MEIFVQFLLRLAFGLAVGMAITSPRQVSSGYFRNHLYVTLGLATLAALASYTAAPEAFWYAVVAAVASYVGSVCWLYERKLAGRVALAVVAVVSLTGAYELLDRVLDRVGDSIEFANYDPPIHWLGYASGALHVVSIITSGLLLGTTIAAMFLGHWYLNSPTMQLAPLRRLLLAMGAALVLQTAVAAVGLACELSFATQLSPHWLLFVILRWSFGIVGVGALTWMAWQTLKIPNTQSATGILYVAVLGVFTGELTGLLLSARSAFPL